MGLVDEMVGWFGGGKGRKLAESGPGPRLRDERHPKIKGKIAELDQELDREVKDQHSKRADNQSR